MDSTASTSLPPDHSPASTRLKLMQPIADRIVRALRHRLRLIHRSESDFFVLGATGNVYTVTLSLTPSCTCPDRTTPCKHILFILIRVLGVSLDDTCLRRRTLRPCQLQRLLSTPTSPDTLARSSIREIFHQLFPNYHARLQGHSVPTARAPIEIEDGTTCPVCLDQMGKEDKVLACSTCRNPIHEECLLTWKRISRRRSATCVICRARWRSNRADQDSYVNLSAYVTEDDMPEPNNLCCD